MASRALQLFRNASLRKSASIEKGQRPAECPARPAFPFRIVKQSFALQKIALFVSFRASAVKSQSRFEVLHRSGIDDNRKMRMDDICGHLEAFVDQESRAMKHHNASQPRTVPLALTRRC